jgi:hypothetical protein
MKMKTWRLVLALFVLATMSAIALGAPYGADSVVVKNASTKNFSGISAQPVSAEAGNVTELEINTTIVTSRWQGYYGNISGRITLDDAAGNTMYDWAGGDGFSPVGHIFAANQTVDDWSDVVCLNLSYAPDVINSSGINAWIGASATDGDSVENTFTAYANVSIGSERLRCPALLPYVSDAAQSGTSYFNVTLLREASQSTLVFGAAVDQDKTGFNGRAYDFQMLVGENGDIAATTTYYFYVELS